MNSEIKKIRLGELEEFVQSETFRNFKTVPITDLRVKSYLNNPHSRPEDIVLYLGFAENQLVAFRTLFAGTAVSGNEKISFAWCSGNWVHPGFRRKGFSELLLNEAFIDWEGKLMFTNYAPDSEKLYLKTGKFRVIHQFEGFRGYLFPKTRKLFSRADKNVLTGLLSSIADFSISVVSTVRAWFYRARQNSEIRFGELTFPDDECYKFHPEFADSYLFTRGEKDLKWIFKFPWISADKKIISQNYPFSSFSKCFNYHTVKVFVKEKFTGFFIFSVREGHLKTLHFCVPNGIEKEIADYLKRFCVSNKIEVATVYKNEIATELLNQKFPFLHAKKYGQKIYSSFEIKNIGNCKFQDGDGDVIFT